MASKIHSWLVKDETGKTVLKTSVQSRAERRAKKPGYKLIPIPETR